jgi:hypothetical protein
MEFARDWRVDAVLIEDAASGQSLIQELRVDTDLSVRPVRVDGDKNVRAAAAQPAVEAGRVLLPAGAAWTDEFLAEVYAFPAGAHDDQVDALTQAIGYLRGTAQHMGFRAFMRSEAILAEAQREEQAAAAERYDLYPVEVARMVEDRQDVVQGMRDAYMATRAQITGRGPYGEPLSCHHCHLPLGRCVYNAGVYGTRNHLWLFHRRRPTRQGQ